MGQYPTGGVGPGQTQQTQQPELSPLHYPNYTPSGTSNEVRGNSAGFTNLKQTNSRFHEDQVLFKSNGFDGPSSRVNESQLPHSPQIRHTHTQLPYHHQQIDHNGRFGATANFQNRDSSSYENFSSGTKFGQADDRATVYPVDQSIEASRASFTNPCNTNYGYYKQEEMHKYPQAYQGQMSGSEDSEGEWESEEEESEDGSYQDRGSMMHPQQHMQNLASSTSSLSGYSGLNKGEHHHHG